MSDQASSGESAATAGAAFSAASSGNSAPAGSFGAKGSGLARGKRPSPAAASAASPAAPSGYQPSTIEVLRPQSEYKNPFTGETSVAAPVVNEPAPQAAPVVIPVATPAKTAPLATAPDAAPSVAAAKDADLFPFTPPAAERAPARVEPATKAELNILPPEQVKRPAVSWGESNPPQPIANGEPRGRRDERPTFRPERRDQRPFEPREPREPRRDSPAEPREQFSRDHERSAPVPAPVQKKSGGFFGWLKSLFGGSAAPEVKTGERDFQGRDGQHRHEGGGRRRHRGGRGRGGYQGGGDNRGPRDGQPRDQSAEGGHGQHGGGEHSGEQRFEGGGRRRRRGGRNRNRDDRGPRPEGQQGGGAI